MAGDKHARLSIRVNGDAAWRSLANSGMSLGGFHQMGLAGV
jgi:hypothetical protein